MFQLYSKGCEYAIRALMAFAPTETQTRFLAKDVCEKAGIPESFTRKTFQALVKARFLKAIPGPGGGYQLIESPSKISLLDIIYAVDGEDTFGKCLVGLKKCNDTQPCPIHNHWKKTKETLIAGLGEKTLQDLIEVQRGQER